MIGSFLVPEYSDGEWSLTLVRCEARTAGEYSVTAENSLGSSTRDWRLRVRPVEAVSRVAVPERSEKTEIKSSNTKDLCKQFEHSQSLAINSVSCKKRDDKEEKSPSASQRGGESDPPGGPAAGRWIER